MKISREELLHIETLVDESTNTIITSDITWEDGVGEVHNGFNVKSFIPAHEFKEAMDSGNPGDYILGHYPADGTFLEGRLERLSIDETLCLINNPISDFYIPGKRRYYIEIWMENVMLDTDHRYVVQTKWFNTKKEAIDWYKNNFDYIDLKYCSVHLMTAQYYQDQDYDIVAAEKLKNI